MTCFWCPSGESESEPGEANPAYAPCAACLARMTKGVTIIEVFAQPQGSTHIGLALDVDVTVYPTGLWAAVEDGYLMGRIQDVPELRLGATMPALRHGYCFVSSEVWDLLGLGRPEVAEAT